MKQTCFLARYLYLSFRCLEISLELIWHLIQSCFRAIVLYNLKMFQLVQTLLEIDHCYSPFLFLNLVNIPESTVE